MSFFIRNKTKGSKSSFRLSGKRKRPNAKQTAVQGGGSTGEEIPSDDEIIDDGNTEDVSSSSEDEETAEQKKLKLAKLYLEEVKKKEQEKTDAEDIDKEVIAHRLKEDVLEQSGKLQKKIAEQLVGPPADNIRILSGHKNTITCIVISADDKYLYSGSKDCSIIKWSVESSKRIKVIQGGRKGMEDKHIGHTSHILCLAISTDNKFLASGCYDKNIKIWDPTTLNFIHTFTGHRGAISGLTFRKGFNQLYSASHDKSVKIWNLEEMAYVETLFGHHSAITSIDSLTRERAISSGGTDNSIRIWKIVEETQLLYQGHKRSIDNVKLINEQHFVSCSADGSIALWGVLKKKPLAVIENAHGVADSEPNWISSIGAMQNADVVASGSKDGYINLWQCGSYFKKLTKLFSLSVDGFVNSLQFTSDGNLLVAGVGQEHRLGRWWNLKKSKNLIYIFPLKKKT